jgi:hypothetical protein
MVSWCLKLVHARPPASTLAVETWFAVQCLQLLEAPIAGREAFAEPSHEASALGAQRSRQQNVCSRIQQQSTAIIDSRLLPHIVSSG